MEIGRLHRTTAQVLERSILQGTLMGATWEIRYLIWRVQKRLMIYAPHKFHRLLPLAEYVDQRELCKSTLIMAGRENFAEILNAQDESKTNTSN